MNNNQDKMLQNINNQPDVKQHKKMYKSGKSWVAAGLVGLSVSLGVAISNTPVNPNNDHHHAEAATVETTGTTGTLAGGDTVDTGNHVLTESTNANFAIFQNAANNNYATKPDSNWVNLIGSTKNSAAGVLYNNQIDMSSNFTFTAGIKSSEVKNNGDSLGFLLTPVNPSDAGAGKTGYGLGIAGLANSIFLGRDYYSNSNSDATSVGQPSSTDPLFLASSSYTGEQSVINIRTTDANGVLQATSSYLDGVTRSTSGEDTSMSWTMTSYNATTNTYTGNLSLTVNGKTITYNNYVSQPKMSVGMVGSTGNYTSNMSVNIKSLAGTKATSKMTVKYVDGAGNSIMPDSTITANVGDKIAINNPASAAGYDKTANYVYNIPTKAGYSANSASSSSVISTDGTQNVVTVQYLADYQQLQVTQHYEDGSQPDAVSKVDGTTGAAINVTAPVIKDGYYIDNTKSSTAANVTVATDGSLTGTFDNTSNGILSNTNKADSSVQSVILDVVASVQQVRLVSATTGEQNPNVVDKTYTGATGKAVEVDVTDADLAKVGYTYTITGPDGVQYATLSAALLANPIYDKTINGSNKIDSDIQTFTITYAPQKVTAKLYYVTPDGVAHAADLTGTQYNSTMLYGAKDQGGLLGLLAVVPTQQVLTTQGFQQLKWIAAGYSANGTVSLGANDGTADTISGSVFDSSVLTYDATTGIWALNAYIYVTADYQQENIVYQNVDGTQTTTTQKSVTGGTFAAVQITQVKGYTSYVNWVAATSISSIAADNTSNVSNMNADGTITVDGTPQVYTVTYVKIATTVSYVNQDGNKLQDDTTANQVDTPEVPTITHYTAGAPVQQADGSWVITYAKTTNTVSYVDEDGNAIQTETDGNQVDDPDVPTIAGYTPAAPVLDADGNWVIAYTSDAQKIVVNYVDQDNGNSIVNSG
ncbi:MAG: KxYKxGKxW signal peptide domain-containing protein, partial [Lactobacillaceae bacterium]|nr:KxYKxGKxW signal peptide domain-containing protein [Lactobacillaceae bacterium]